MSSVGSTDRKNQTDMVRKNRDDYSSKEAELIKKHKRELRQLSDSHQQELERIQETFDRTINDLKERSHDTLTDQDRSHQEEIGKVREAYLSQIRRAAEDNEQKREALRQSTSGDLESQKRISKMQQDTLKNSFDNELREKDGQIQDIMNRTHEQSQKSFANIRKGLSDDKEREMKVLREEKQEKLAQAQRDYDNLGKVKKMELQDLRRGHANEVGRLQDMMVSNIKDERQSHSEGMEMQREGFREAIDDVREKFRRAQEKEQDKTRDSYGTFKDDVNERVNGRVKSLEKQIHELKQQQTLDRAKMHQRYEQEKKNVVEAYSRNTEDLQNQRDQLVHQSVDNTHRDVENMRREKDQFIGENSRYYQDRIDKMRALSQEDSIQKDSFYKNQKEHSEVQQENRIKHIRSQAELEKQGMREFAEQSVEQSKQAKQDAIRAERMKSIQERAQFNNKLSDDLRRQEGEYAEKLQTVQDQYQQQLAELKNQQKRELNQVKTQVDQRLNEQAKATDMALQTQELQHQRKVAQINARHEEEMKDMNRRHQAQIDHLVTHLKQS